MIEQLLRKPKVIGQGDLKEAADPARELAGVVAGWEAPCDVYDFLWDGGFSMGRVIGSWGGRTWSVESMTRWRVLATTSKDCVYGKGELYLQVELLIEGQCRLILQRSLHCRTW